MKTKVKNVVDAITGVLKEWPRVETVVLQHFVEKDVFDPGFSITLDVFRDGDIPSREERRDIFPGSSYFETSQVVQKDRFLVEDLPVRISYKDVGRVVAVLEATGSESWLAREKGTYLFHRLATGTVVFDRSGWIDETRKKLDDLSEAFWSSWIESCHMRIDHYLGDLGAAVVNDDALYFRLALTGFLKTVAEAIFAANRVFEPGPRDLTGALALLDEKPSGFEANWNSLLRDDGELPPERKREVATLLARGVFSLSS